MSTDRENWNTDPDAAYAEAMRRIEFARLLREPALVLGGSRDNAKTLRALSKIPPLNRLSTLVEINLDNTQVADISRLASFRSLRSLRIENTQVADLSSVAHLNSLNDGAKAGGGLHYADTPAVQNDPVLQKLAALNTRERTAQTLLYLRGQHPDHSGYHGTLCSEPLDGTVAELFANPPAKVTVRNHTIDLDPDSARDKPAYDDDDELSRLPRMQTALLFTLAGALDNHLLAARNAAQIYGDEMRENSADPILEILKQAFATLHAGIEEAKAEGALYKDAEKAWESFCDNHALLMAHFPLDAARERIYRDAPVNVEKAAPGKAFDAFRDFLAKLKDATIAPIIGSRLRDWAEVSEAASEVALKEHNRRLVADPATGPDDAGCESLSPAMLVRRLVAQGYSLANHLHEWWKTEAAKKFKDNVNFAAAIVGLFTALSIMF